MSHWRKYFVDIERTLGPPSVDVATCALLCEPAITFRSRAFFSLPRSRDTSLIVVFTATLLLMALERYAKFCWIFTFDYGESGYWLPSWRFSELCRGCYRLMLSCEPPALPTRTGCLCGVMAVRWCPILPAMMLGAFVGVLRASFASFHRSAAVLIARLGVARGPSLLKELREPYNRPLATYWLCATLGDLSEKRSCCALEC